MMRTALARISVLSQPDVITGWLSAALLDQAPNGKRRDAWVAGRVLLAQQVGQRPLREMIITASGKPTFRCAQLPHFNISHSGDFVFVAVSDKGPIGCDIEVIRPRSAAIEIAQHYFGEAEYLWLAAQPAENVMMAFWRLWTAREALLKQRGLSVWQMRSIALKPETLGIVGSEIFHWYQQGLSVAVSCCLPESANSDFTVDK
ncbi:4'-phosphopantetheinyl transferase superfamily protein [Yersinia nurmii]|uniref:4'-phosphopantetheinyl transferase superfamily protein n=1 Tax=Yersinia nurmii TaxID=685706 RepID=A0AAW7JYW1_9GAMM|nr:4'-phosphopantetheinyl transferase superfamily protein [Yersinia nurmii]MDN0086185.1 4'-phosphopantetheinyl transferase superfamily protein [Yersinia nurmii]